MGGPSMKTKKCKTSPRLHEIIRDFEGPEFVRLNAIAEKLVAIKETPIMMVSEKNTVDKLCRKCDGKFKTKIVVCCSPECLKMKARPKHKAIGRCGIKLLRKKTTPPMDANELKDAAGATFITKNPHELKKRADEIIERIKDGCKVDARINTC